MPIFSRLMFDVLRWRARHGWNEPPEIEETSPSENTEDGHAAFAAKKAAQRAGHRGETYGYWYLRKLGYVFVAKNYIPRGGRGELDLIGYDGGTLAFVEIRTRTITEESTALPEMSVTSGKQRVLVRTARRYLTDRRITDGACRFDVLAIDNCPGRPPALRLHKEAFRPQKS